MTAPTLFAQGATVANTTGSLTVTLPTHAADDILVLCLAYWGPNTIGAAAAIPTPSGWTQIDALSITPASEIDGRIAWFWKRAASGSETNPVCSRGSLWDTGNDTCFGGRAYTVRGCRTSGTPWDQANPSGPWFAANQAFQTVTVSGNERSVIQFGCSTDNQAFAMTATDWTTGTEDNDATGTDCSFQTARKENISSSTTGDTATVSVAAQGAYAFLGVSFFPQVFTVSSGGVASGEGIGSPKLNLKIQPPGLGTAEAFGTPTVAVSGGSQTVSPSSIATAEALGSAKLNQKIVASGIVSGEALGAAKLNQAVAPPSITTAEALGALKINQRLAPPGLASAEALGSARISLYARPPGIATAEAFGAIQQLARMLPAGSIVSGEALGAPRLNLYARPGGIASAEAFGAVQQLRRTLPAGSIASAEAFGLAAVVTGGAQTISGAGAVASAEAFGTARLNLRVSPSGIASAEVFGAIQQLARKLLAGSVASAEALGTPRLGAYIRPSGISSAEAFGFSSATRWLQRGAPVLYQVAAWHPALAFYFEAYIRASSGSARARLWDLTAGVDVAGSEVSTTAGTLTRLRSGALVLVDNHEYVAEYGTESPNVGGGRGGKLVVKS